MNVFISHPSHFLTDNQPHGDGLIAYQYISNLAAAGHELHVALPLADLHAPLPPNVTLHPIKTQTPASSGAQPLRYRAEYARAVHRLFLDLRKTIAFDVIHQLNPAVLGLSVLLRGYGVPIVMGPVVPPWEDQRPSRVRRRLKQVLQRTVFSRCDVALIPAESSQRMLCAAGVPASKLRLLHYGVDTNHFRPSAEAGPETPTVLFLANMQERKGIYTLLEAFDLLAGKHPLVRLKVGGAGEDSERVAELVAASPYRDRIDLLGHISREDAPAHFQQCTVYTLPSFGEPFGMTALEAMACGKAVVCTNQGGLADLVRPQGGLQVPPRDAAALATALETLLCDERRRAAMGSFNRALVEREYAWPAVAARLTEIYAEAVASPKLKCGPEAPVPVRDVALIGRLKS